MRVELHVTSGSRAGQRELFDKSVITIGRHPINDFRFHPENDPDVSSKHAEIRLLESSAVVYDLASTNGTFVNGLRVQGERAIGNGDVIAFGAEGPRVEFRVVTQVSDRPPATRLSKTPEGVPAVGSAEAEPGIADTIPGRSKAAASAKAEGRGAKAGAGAPRRDTTMRIAEAVEKQTGTLRTMVMGLAALVVVGVGSAWWIERSNSVKAQAQIDGLLKKNDSLNAAFERSVSSMKGKVAGLDSALVMTKADRARLRARIQSEMAKGGANVEDLAAQLDAAEGRQRSLLTAARVDFEAIVAKNAPAMVFIAVRHANGEATSGSGFNIAPSGLVVTNKHVVQDANGQPAKTVLVIFEGKTAQWKHAHVIKVSATDELAWIKIDEGGGYPVVAGVAKDPNIHVGAPSAIIGYPLGTSTAGMGGEIEKLTPRSTLSISTVSKVLAETLQLDTYAAEGSSGSPVFDARGFVVGVLYGGVAESNGRIVYAVPGQRLVAQMPPEGAAIIR